MTVKELIDRQIFRVVNLGEELDREVTKVFCCDLLSIAMGKAPADGAWVTVMGNVNTIAVATLADVSCVIMAEEVSLDEVARARAKEQGVTRQGIHDLVRRCDRILQGYEEKLRLVEKFQETRQLAERIQEFLREYQERGDAALLEKAGKAAAQIAEI